MKKKLRLPKHRFQKKRRKIKLRLFSQRKEKEILRRSRMRQRLWTILWESCTAQTLKTILPQKMLRTTETGKMQQNLNQRKVKIADNRLRNRVLRSLNHHSQTKGMSQEGKGSKTTGRKREEQTMLLKDPDKQKRIPRWHRRGLMLKSLLRNKLRSIDQTRRILIQK